MSTLQVNTISESTSGSGVTIDGVKLKDNIVETDTINEKTSAAGVTIDGVLIKDGLVDGKDVSAITQGVTDIDQWRWTSNVSATEVLADSWARPNGTLQGAYIGSGMAVDSSTGAWTFPSTGIWQIVGTFYLHIQSTSATYLTMQSIATDDNFSSEDIVDYAVHFDDRNVARATVSNVMLVDIQNTSNDKIKFKFVEGSGTGQLEGTTNENRTYITFTRIGDT